MKCIRSFKIRAYFGKIHGQLDFIFSSEFRHSTLLAMTLSEFPIGCHLLVFNGTPYMYINLILKIPFKKNYTTWTLDRKFEAIDR